MEKNVGGLDRFFRLGISFLSMAIVLASEDTFLRLIFGGVALIGLATATTGYCPINAKLGFNTRGKKDNK